MFGRKISVDSELYEQLKQCAEAGGYSSPEEFAIHSLEKAVDQSQGNSAPAAESQALESNAAESGPAVASALETAADGDAAIESSVTQSAEAAGAEPAGTPESTVPESAAVQTEQGGDDAKSLRL